MGVLDWLGLTSDYNQDASDYKKYDPAIAGAAQGFQQNQIGQQSFIDMLRKQLAEQGGGPSPAQLMLQQQTQENAQQAAGAVGSVRGLNPALQARMILDQQAGIQQRAAGQGATLRAQESIAESQRRLQQQGLLGQALGQQGNQNLGMFGTAGGLQNQGVLGAGAINAGVAQANANVVGSIVGGALGGAGAAYAGGGKAHGGMVDGGQGMIPGDHPANDVVPTRLSPGEIVIPRSIAMSPEAPDAAAAFIRAIKHQHQEGAGYADGGPVYWADAGAKPDDESFYSGAAESILMGGFGGAVRGALRPRNALGGGFESAARAAFKPSKGYADGGLVGGDPETLAQADDLAAQVAMQDVLASRTAAPSLPWESKPAAPSPYYDAGDAGTIRLPDAPQESIKGVPPLLAKPAQESMPDLSRMMQYTPPPKAPPAMSSAPTASGLPTGYEAAQKSEQMWLQNQADVASQKSDAEAGIAAAAAATQQELAAQHAKMNADRQAGADRLFSDVQSSKLDPNRYYANQSTGDKITSAISLILGGMGAGLTHGPNLALQVIEKAIDRDIDAQKMEIGKKQNALSHYMQQTGDIRMAQQLAKADARDVAAAQMSAAALKFGGAQAQAQAQTMIAAARKASITDRLQVASLQTQNQMGQMQLQSAKLSMERARYMMGEVFKGGGGDAERGLAMSFIEHPEKQSEYTVNVPTTVKVPTGKGGGHVEKAQDVPRLALSPQAAEKAREAFISTGLIRDKLKVLRELADKGRLSTSFSPEDMQRAKAAAAGLKESYERGFNLVNAQPSEKTIEAANEIIKDPTKWLQLPGTIEGSLKYMEEDLSGVESKIRRQYLHGRKGD